MRKEKTLFQVERLLQCQLQWSVQEQHDFLVVLC